MASSGDLCKQNANGADQPKLTSVSEPDAPQTPEVPGIVTCVTAVIYEVL